MGEMNTKKIQLNASAAPVVLFIKTYLSNDITLVRGKESSHTFQGYNRRSSSNAHNLYFNRSTKINFTIQAHVLL
jgi:hypothetical protein